MKRIWQRPGTLFQTNDLATMDNAPSMVTPPLGGGGQVRTTTQQRVAPPPAGGTINQQTTDALANAIQNLANVQNGTYNFNDNTKTLSTPRSITFTATSTFQTSAITKTVIAFNQDYGLPTSPTSNGGATSIAYNYNDLPAGSTDGNLISQIFGQMGRGTGMWCYGFTLVYTTVVSGASTQNSAAIINSNPTVNYYNGDTTIKPLYINVQEAIRNNMYQNGTLTIVKGFNLSRTAQVTFVLPAGDGATANAATTLTATFMFRKFSM